MDGYLDVRRVAQWCGKPLVGSRCVRAAADAAVNVVANGVACGRSDGYVVGRDVLTVRVVVGAGLSAYPQVLHGGVEQFDVGAGAVIGWFGVIHPNPYFVSIVIARQNVCIVQAGRKVKF